MVKKFTLLIFVIALTWPGLALAARQVQGTVPQTKPLQPPPASISPNLSRNVQDSPADDAAVGSSVPANLSEGSNSAGTDSDNSSAAAEANSSSRAVAGAPARNRWPLAAVLAAILIAVFVWRWRKARAPRL